MLSVLITVAVVAALLFWFGVSFRRILHLRARVTQGWKRLDEHIKERMDIVGRTLGIAQNAGMQGVELDRLADLHAQAARYRGPADAARRNAELDRALKEVLSLMAQHPDTTDAARSLTKDFDAVSRAVSAARDGYNDLAASYNRAIAATPGNLIAAMTGFHRAESFA